MNANVNRLAVSLMPTSLGATNFDNYVAKFVTLRYRTPSPDELDARRTAQDLKIPTDAAIQIAAPAMATLIDGPCWLIPVPASNGSLTANLALARAIAEYVRGARVKCAVGRAHPVEPSHTRLLRGLPRLTVDQHAIVRTAGLMQPWPVYFVDNVITTGTTIAACRRALGWGTGLAYADASKPHKEARWPTDAWQTQALHDRQLVCEVRYLRLPEDLCLTFLELKDRTPVYQSNYILSGDYLCFK